MKIENKVVYRHHGWDSDPSANEEFAKLNAEGWELVQVDGCHAFFKRNSQQEEKKEECKHGVERGSDGKKRTVCAICDFPYGKEPKDQPSKPLIVKDDTGKRVLSQGGYQGVGSVAYGGQPSKPSIRESVEIKLRKFAESRSDYAYNKLTDQILDLITKNLIEEIEEYDLASWDVDSLKESIINLINNIKK